MATRKNHGQQTMGAAVLESNLELSFAELRRLVQSTPAVDSGDKRLSRCDMARENIRRLERILEADPQKPITQEHVADVLCMEASYCSRIFPDLTGKYFCDWINGIRVSHALKLLTSCVNLSITEISHQSGFGDIGTFERKFRKHTGLSPLEFRRAAITPPPTSIHSEPESGSEMIYAACTASRG